MCGIAALWGDDDVDLVAELVERLAHRGPDGAGVHRCADAPAVLGHRRLAIIDPVGGAQPLVHADGRSALVHNGMIYNDRALRAGLAGAPWRTASDSESILHACPVGDPLSPRRLDGMFAFVEVDSDELLAARDPVGIKPLYVGRRGDALLLASEIKALLGVADDIRTFPAGHALHSRHGFVRHYDLPGDRTDLLDVETATRAVRAALERAVVKRLRSDVPLGALLSGGLDSSAIAAIARQHVAELHTFAVGVEGSPDLLAARRVAEHIGTIHHERMLTAADTASALPRVLRHLESHDCDLVRSAVPCWFVSELAAEHVKVVLTGEGADELFAGYAYHRRLLDLDPDGDALHAELRRSIGDLHHINLQRVDRMTMAHGLEARVPFLDTGMIALAMRIHPTLKLRPVGDDLVEKWILRRAVADLLPADVAWRTKAQFDEGSGATELLATGDRDDEEAAYRALLAAQFDDPGPLLTLVARWGGRPADRRDGRPDAGLSANAPVG